MQLNISRLFLIILAMLSSIESIADDFVFIGKVLDSGMHEPIEYATIRVYNLPDSVVLGKCKADNWIGQPDGSEKEYTGEFNVRIQRVKKCAVEFSATGFQTVWKNINLDSLGSRVGWFDVGTVFMKVPGRQLDEVVVTASKIKFYNKGDTIVYNADAFKLAEGSMLDALIEQLPGVELRDDGAIFVQGKYVESLMLNGKEFLGSNNQILLSNLPSYTVKNVQVYDKLGRASELAGVDLGDSQYVMDVKLKKEYMVGVNINAEAGMGTDSRYLGRLFGMGFTPNNQYMAYFNANNLNDSRKPGQSGSWSPEKMPTGVLRTVMGGFDYNIKSRNQAWEIKGTVNAIHTNETDGTDRIRTNYLVDRSTYGYSFAKERNKMLSLNTSHNIYWKRDRFTGIQATPSFSYKNWDRSSNSVSATFSQDYNDITSSFIEGIYSGENDKVLETMLNREISAMHTKGHSLNSGIGLNQMIMLGNGDMLTANVTGAYNNKHESRDKAYDIRFQEVPDESSSKLQRFRDYPNHNHKVSADIGYRYYPFKNASFLFEYGYANGYEKTTSILHYNDEQSQIADFLLGMLPSATSSLVFDTSNSYISRERYSVHKFRFEFGYQSPDWWVSFRLPMKLAQRKLNYDRGDIHTTVKYDRLLFDVVNSFVEWRKDNNRVQLAWDIKSIEPGMIHLVDYVDTTDPMIVLQGNPDLKTALRVDARLRYRMMKSGEFAEAQIRYGQLHNGIAQGYEYETSTGIRRSKYMNVNGNWDASASGSYNKQINRFEVRSELTLSHVTNVDLIGQDNSGLSRSEVFDNNIFYRIKAGYSFPRIRLGLDFLTKFGCYTSNRADFISQNTWNFNTGLNAVATLPANFQLSADLTMYNRRGFTDEALNTNNFVLNARLSKTLLKGSMVLMLDGYDILHDLSNVSYTVNAQGRTETYRTVLPRYFMFHVQWRFNHTPKRNGNKR